MRYPVVHNQALGCGAVYGSDETRPAKAEDFELDRASRALGEVRAFVGRLLVEKASLAGILGQEKADLAVLQAMDSLKRVEDRVRALGGKL